MRNITKYLIITMTILNLMYCYAQKPKVYKAPEFRTDWNKPTLQPDRIVVSLGEDPSSILTVTWRTSTEVNDCYVEIAKATAAPKFWRNAVTIKAQTTTLDASKIEKAELRANYHSVVCENLEPNTLYGYRVGDGKHWSEWVQVKTASNKAERFSFLYVGDAQNYILELWSRLIREGYKTAPDASFIIHAGDLVNRAHNDQEWHEWFEAGGWIHRMVPSFPVPGNHEYNAIENNGEKVLSVQWRPQFTLPQNGPKGLEETVYYMDYQGARIIGLNSLENKEVQAKWLENVLKNNPNKWTIVTYHHPIYSASSGRDNKEWRDTFKPLFDKYKVDLALQGHDHSYARGRVAPTEYNLVSGVNKRDQTGTVYVVSVSGGKMYNLNPNAWNEHEADRERAAENTQLFQVVTVDGDKLVYESYTATGELYDEFHLLKNENAPNTFVEMQHKAISGRYHNNTISYYDKLPLNIENKLLESYVGHIVNRVNLTEENGILFYNVELKKGEETINLKLNEVGAIIGKKN